MDNVHTVRRHYLVRKTSVVRGMCRPNWFLPVNVESYKIGEGWVPCPNEGREIRDMLMDYGDSSVTEIDEIQPDLAEAIIKEQEKTGHYDIWKTNPELKAFALKSMNKDGFYYADTYFDGK